MTTSGTRIRVLVVDDSPSQRGWLMALLDSDPQLELAGWAEDGASAIRAAARLRPDIITMDFRMPGIDGLEATRQIMHDTPTPIVLVAALGWSEDPALVADALEAGALAVELKAFGRPEDARRLLETIKSMASVRVLRRRLPRPHVASVTGPPHTAPGRPVELIAIGASTGGPQALKEVLQHLPQSCRVPIVIVQHMSTGFVPSLVYWLDRECALPVQVAQHGRRLDGPGIHIAPSDQHLIVRRRTMYLTSEPPVNGHRPSVTTLFHAVSSDYGAAAVGVLLTGMGEDGATGLRDMKCAGAITVAQNQASCIVFGMPAAAIELGVADYILPPPQIGFLLDRLAQPVAQLDRAP